MAVSNELYKTWTSLGDTKEQDHLDHIVQANVKLNVAVFYFLSTSKLFLYKKEKQTKHQVNTGKFSQGLFFSIYLKYKNF